MITLETYPQFKELYETAIKNKKDYFTFNDKPVLVTYAKYVIEYLDSIK